jgi:hypothetical protein
MSDNVIILGAGFSVPAGIPVMRDFVDTMMGITARKAYQGTALSQTDIDLFERAAAVRVTLDGYHGRARFDERNIEDVLSILAFNAYANDQKAEVQLRDFSRAIARTIELTCNVKHPGVTSIQNYQDPAGQKHQWYLSFWNSLLQWASEGNSFPTIITFNYDLVLERSLFQLLVGPVLGAKRQEILPQKHLRVCYHNKMLPSLLYQLERADFIDSNRTLVPGTVVKYTSSDASDNELKVEILKLHGSVNFPATGATNLKAYNLAEALDDPQILPPIFNKLSDRSNTAVWEVAMKRLREARNVVVVGYSLPRSDIYMQYFLKAALGPNLRFDKLSIYNPSLWRADDEDAKMRERFRDCFAEQMMSRIVFTPQTYLQIKNDAGKNERGTTKDFINTLASNPAEILFSAHA